MCMHWGNLNTSLINNVGTTIIIPCTVYKVRLNVREWSEFFMSEVLQKLYNIAINLIGLIDNTMLFTVFSIHCRFFLFSFLSVFTVFCIPCRFFLFSFFLFSLSFYLFSLCSLFLVVLSVFTVVFCVFIVILYLLSFSLFSLSFSLFSLYFVLFSLSFYLYSLSFFFCFHWHYLLFSVSF